MMMLFLLVCIATVLIGLGIGILLFGSYLLGRPLSKGCGKTDCCRNKKTQKTTTTLETKTHDDLSPPDHSS